MFHPVEQNLQQRTLEERILEKWEQEQTFQATLDANADGPRFVVYEGPPTANGKPGVHHVESRVFKDIYPRYRTMKGYYVPRTGGWDCHGIPVELGVEKELGLKSKPEIEQYGIEAFNKKCRESVQTYVEEWHALTNRVGYWVDLDKSYWTMTNDYVESVWWSLKTLFDGGNIYEGHKVVPYCGRCGTALSDHEVAQGYDITTDPSVYVRFPVISDGALKDAGASLAIWTTTPWTLYANMLVGIGNDIHYVLAKQVGDDYPVVIAAELAQSVLGEDVEIIRDVPVDELLGTRYRAPFEDLQSARYVVDVDFVTTTSGTGLVHQAGAFGADDHAVVLAHGLDLINPVGPDARFTEQVPAHAGEFVKDADKAIIKDLRALGLLIAHKQYEHSYPFCWRCKNPLIYYATPSWYVRTTVFRDRMLEENAGVDWHPEHIRDGRYGEWLRNNIDWALSRTRYWGTPLPIWRSDDGEEVVVIGSLAELSERTGRDLTGMDPHRPYIDEITIPSQEGRGELKRVPDVIDAWYDSGAMPFAQFGYPWVPGSEQAFEAAFPADYISEAIDQTRGWFYSLMAESVALFDKVSYKSVSCLGHIVDAEGKKMSKSKGNILDPWEVVNTFGADPLRWLMLTDGSPWTNRRVGDEPLKEISRRFFSTLWNSYYFFVTYARIDGWTPATSHAPERTERSVMDRWILAELADLVSTVDTSLEHYDATNAGRALEAFVDGLSNWYIRRSRARFWAEGDSADKQAAFATLHECLVTLTALLAPFIPFTAEALYENLVLTVDEHAPSSVHLLPFPTPDEQMRDAALQRAMRGARSAVTLGLRARNDVQIGVRQPLPEAVVTVADQTDWDLVQDVVAEELNIKSLTLSAPGAQDSVKYTLKANFRELGTVFGKQTPVVAKAITELDPPGVVDACAANRPVSVTLPDGSSHEIAPTMIQIIEEGREGWQVASEIGMSVALRTEITPELRLEGLAREVIRAVNNQRKDDGLDLADRIDLTLGATGQLAEAITTHTATIQAETLAVSLNVTDVTDGPITIADQPLSIGIRISS
ncbi:isoleucine--tRNA ligase [Stomatohabitans albus]|uniref:isoleucine--tRNA ligase n=1 Tax=Stomatohabitans albus TaxID=3110766 RepID=UPI00300D2346